MQQLSPPPLRSNPPQAWSDTWSQPPKESGAKKDRSDSDQDPIKVPFAGLNGGRGAPPAPGGFKNHEFAAHYHWDSESEVSQTTMIPLSVREVLARASYVDKSLAGAVGKDDEARAEEGRSQPFRDALEVSPGPCDTDSRDASGRGGGGGDGPSSQGKGPSASELPPRPHGARSGPALGRGGVEYKEPLSSPKGPSTEVGEHKEPLSSPKGPSTEVGEHKEPLSSPKGPSTEVGEHKEPLSSPTGPSAELPPRPPGGAKSVGAAPGRAEDGRPAGALLREGSASDLHVIAPGRVTGTRSVFEKSPGVATTGETWKTAEGKAEDGDKRKPFSPSARKGSWKRLDSGAWQRVEDGGDVASVSSRDAPDAPAKTSRKHAGRGGGGDGGGDGGGKPLSADDLARCGSFNDSEDDASATSDENSAEATPTSAAAAAAAGSDGQKPAAEGLFEPADGFWTAVRSLVGGRVDGSANGHDQVSRERQAARATTKSFPAAAVGSETPLRHGFGRECLPEGEEEERDIAEGERQRAGGESDPEHSGAANKDVFRPLQAIGDLFRASPASTPPKERPSLQEQQKQQQKFPQRREGALGSASSKQEVVLRSGAIQRPQNEPPPTYVQLVGRRPFDSVRLRAASQNLWDLPPTPTHGQELEHGRLGGEGARRAAVPPREPQRNPSGNVSRRGNAVLSGEAQHRPGISTETVSSPSTAGPLRVDPDDDAGPETETSRYPASSPELPPLIDPADLERDGIEAYRLLPASSAGGPRLGRPMSSQSWSSSSSSRPPSAFSPNGGEDPESRPTEIPQLQSPLDSELSGSMTSPGSELAGGSLADPPPRFPPPASRPPAGDSGDVDARERSALDEMWER